MICTTHPLFAGDNIEKNEIGGACSADGEGEGFVQGKRPLERSRCIWEDNIKANI
jgi:hypothetical protein